MIMTMITTGALSQDAPLVSRWVTVALAAARRAYAARETAFRFCMRPSQDLLHAGDSARWDVSALGFILLRSSVHPLPNGSADRDCVAHIAALRNSLCHNREVPPGACSAPPS